jgi:phosphopantothenate synthetase
LLGDGKPTYSRKYLLFYVRNINRIARKLDKVGKRMKNHSRYHIDRSVAEYHRKKNEQRTD